MLSCMCLLLPVLATGTGSPVAGVHYESGSRVVEVAVRYAKKGMEDQFQLARKEITDAVRSYEGCLNYREFEATEGTFGEVAGGPSTLADIGEKVYMMMMEYSNETRFMEIAAMPDVQVAAGHLIPTINAVSFFLSQPMDPQFDVGGFAPGSATVDVRITRNVRNAGDGSGTQFEVLYSPADLSNVDGLEMWVDVDKERTDGYESSCVACMKII